MKVKLWHKSINNDRQTFVCHESAQKTLNNYWIVVCLINPGGVDKCDASKDAAKFKVKSEKLTDKVELLPLDTNMQLLPDSLFQLLPLVAKHYHLLHLLTLNSGMR
jgi:hypothetical protein